MPSNLSLCLTVTTSCPSVTYLVDPPLRESSALDGSDEQQAHARRSF